MHTPRNAIIQRIPGPSGIEAMSKVYRISSILTHLFPGREILCKLPNTAEPIGGVACKVEIINYLT